MTNTIAPDPYFDDEDEDNEEMYRKLLKNHETLPPCDSTILPVSSISQRCMLCSRIEAEEILKTNANARPGNFIVRPSAHSDHPYSLSVLFNENSIYHFQIGQISNKYVLGPLERIDLLKSKTFPSLSACLEYYLTSPLKFQDDKGKQRSITLQLYSPHEMTRF